MGVRFSKNRKTVRADPHKILDGDKDSVSDFYGDTPDYHRMGQLLLPEREHMHGHPNELTLIPCIPADTVS